MISLSLPTVRTWCSPSKQPGAQRHAIVSVHCSTRGGATSGVAGPAQDSGNANQNNDFRNVGGSGQNTGYIFNLSTNGLATGTYALQFTVTGAGLP